MWSPVVPGTGLGLGLGLALSARPCVALSATRCGAWMFGLVMSGCLGWWCLVFGACGLEFNGMGVMGYYTKCFIV